MPYEYAQLGLLFAVYWWRVPVEAEITPLLRTLENARKRSAKPLVYLAVIPADVEVPEGAERRTLALFGQRASPFVSAAHLVLEGDGFKHALQRSVVTAMFTSRGGTSRVSCYRSTTDALDALAVAVGEPAPKIEGLLTELARQARSSMQPRLAAHL